MSEGARPLSFEAFEERAWEDWARIPDEYKDGVDGLMVEREARMHPEMEDVYTLGECVTESYPSDFSGPETVRSLVVLYYGSFHRLSRVDEEFDWESELWETLTHELQHHLESLASDDSLIDVDYGMDENFKRVRGDAFDVGFYRYGEPAPGGWFRLEEAYFTEAEPDAAGMAFEWQGRSYRVREPDADADLIYLRVVDGVLDAPDELYLVWRRPMGWRRTLRTLLRREVPSTEEVEVEAELIA
jgi:hypothetical protein